MSKRKKARKAVRGSPGRAGGEGAGGWQRYRQEILFVAVFVLALGASYTLISLPWVNDRVIEPFTAAIARASGVALALLGQDIRMQGTMILSDAFSVNIRNGCNGVEAMLIFFAAVIAFPARWSARLAGLAIGFVAIQAVNLLRVIALYLTGAYLPDLFDASHTVVWQTIVVLFAGLLWIFWARRFAGEPPTDASAA